MLLARYLVGLTLIAGAWFAPAAAQGQPAQVEAVPETQGFDMWDLLEFPKDAITLPEIEDIDLPEEETGETDKTDPCRHFTEEQRRRLPTLCGPNG